jgi:hypothetical protein
MAVLELDLAADEVRPLGIDSVVHVLRART